MTVTRDTLSGYYMPASSAEWTELLLGTGLSAPASLWLLQEASGNLADSIGSITLTAAGGLQYQSSVTGWTRKAIRQLDGAGTATANTGASMPDLNTTSMTVLVFMAIANTPAAQRSTFNLGPGGAKNNNISIEYTTSNFHVIADGTTSGTGSTNHGTGVVRAIARFNRTATTSDLFINSSGTEKISKTYRTPAASSKGLWLGSSYLSTPTIQFLYACMWSGAGAEMSDADITTLLSRIQNGPSSLVIARNRLVNAGQMGPLTKGSGVN